MRGNHIMDHSDQPDLKTANIKKLQTKNYPVLKNTRQRVAFQEFQQLLNVKLAP